MGSVNSIESMALLDGPGVRCAVFLNGCKLRCKYCHNPEMWNMLDDNMSKEELVKKIKRFEPYFKKNGGVTFSGGEALLQKDYLIDVCKELKKDNIHICLDTAGVGIPPYEELLKYVDLILLDIKHTDKDEYKELTGMDIKYVEEFIKVINKLDKKVWIRQVIIPGYNDNIDYINSLNTYIKRINNIEKIEFLPYHSMAKEKYDSLGIDYVYKDLPDMDKKKCDKLYKEFIKIYKGD